MKLNCRMPFDWLSDFGQCLFDWQTLAAGVLAVSGAMFTIKIISKQISQAEMHRNDEIERRHQAARVALPLALSAVSELTQTISDNIALKIENYDPETGSITLDAILDDENETTLLPKLTIPENVIDSFQQFTETLSQKDEIRHIAELLSSLQILLSRYNSFNFNQAGFLPSMHGLLMDAGKVRLLIDQLYNYSRFVEDETFAIVGTIDDKTAWEKILGKAQSLVFKRENPDIFLAALSERTKRYKDNAVSPWIEKFDV